MNFFIILVLVQFVFLIQNRKIIIDTDGAEDDIMAIQYLLLASKLNPQIQIDSILLTGAGEAYCEQGLINLKKLLIFTQYQEIPVLCGSNYPTQGYYQFPSIIRDHVNQDFFPNINEENYQNNNFQNYNASDYLIQTLTNQKNDEKFELIVLGPLTNLAVALQQNEEITKKLETVYFMGGAVFTEGNVNIPPLYETINLVSEWNAYVDSKAAQIVFQDSKIKIKQISLDSTNQVPANKQFLQKFTELYKQQAQDISQFGKNQIEYQLQHWEQWINQWQEGIYFWDLLAAVEIIEQNICQFKELDIIVISEEISQDQETKSERQQRLDSKNFPQDGMRTSLREVENGRTQNIKDNNSNKVQVCLEADTEIFFQSVFNVYSFQGLYQNKNNQKQQQTEL